MDAQSKQIILNQIRVTLTRAEPTGPYLLEALTQDGGQS